MIKKLNTLILVLLGVMVAFKLTLNASKSQSAVPGEKFVPAEIRNAEFAPEVHYLPLLGLAFDNPLTNRRGYLLDVVRGIFPNARYHGKAAPDLAWFREELGAGPDNAAILPREIAVEQGLAVSESVLYRQQIVIYTQRRNAWSYTGPESLRNLRLGVREDLYKLIVARGFAEKLGKNVRIYKPGEDGYAHFAKAVLSGEVDGYLIQRQGLAFANTEDYGARGDLTLNLRCSPSVCDLQFVLAVPKADPDYAKKLLAAFEKGYREIEKSGELRRIREYYAH